MALAGCMAMLASLAFWAFEHPESLLNDHTLNYVLGLLHKRLTSVHWRQAHLSASSVSKWSKGISLSFSDFCFESADSKTNLCFENGELSFVVDFRKFRPEVSEIKLFRLRNANLSLSEEEGSPDFTLPLPAIQALEETAFHALDIEDVRWSRQTRTGTSKGWLQLRSAEENGHTTLKAQFRSQSSIGNVSAHGTLVPEGVSESVFRLRTFRFHFELGYKSGSRGATAVLDGEKMRHRAVSKMDFDATGPVPYVKGIHARGCDVIAEREMSSGHSIIGLKCDSLVRPSTPPRLSEFLELEPEIKVLLRARLEAPSFPPSPFQKVSGTVDADLEPVLFTGLVGSHWHVHGAMEGAPADPPDLWVLRSDFGFNIHIPDFHEVVERLKDTDWAIYAPFHVLRGDVLLTGSGELSRWGGQVPLTLTTKLSSKNQVLDSVSKGTLSLDLTRHPLAKFQADVSLSNVQLQLPTLKFDAPTRLYPAKSIHHFSGSEAAKNDLIDYNLRLKTAGGAPARLLSTLSNRPIPVELDISKAKDKPVLGKIMIRDFSTELFNRGVRVEHFAFDLRYPYRETLLDGSLQTKFPEVTAELSLLGTVGRPIVRFSSDPPLTQHELVAVVLFGRRLDDLNADESSSVSSTSAALTDSAFELASLYALASTPVQSVVYDPEQGTVSAKVSLSDSMSLDMGSDNGGVGEVGVRRRISSHWAVTTDLDHVSDGAQHAVSAIIEWINRY